MRQEGMCCSYMGAPWYSLLQRLLQMNKIQHPQPEEHMVTRGSGCSSMRIWVMAPGKLPRPEEVEAKCEGNLDYIVERHMSINYRTTIAIKAKTVVHLTKLF